MASDYLINTVKGYEDYIRRQGIDEQLLEAYKQAIYFSMYKDRDINYGVKLAGKVKNLYEKFIFDTTGGTSWDLEKYSFEKSIPYKILDDLYEVILVEAQNKNVDSYFRYIEKNREPKERFYMPRRKQFLKIGLMDGLQGMIDDKYDMLLISLIPGAGKAGRMSSKVLTPDGFIEMREVKVGTSVVAGNGEKSSVIGVYPQGKRPIYRVTMNDGSYTEVSDKAMMEFMYSTAVRVGELVKLNREDIRFSSKDLIVCGKGDKVTNNGKTWQSTTDNNVWEPGVYGWEEV